MVESDLKEKILEFYSYEMQGLAFKKRAVSKKRKNLAEEYSKLVAQLNTEEKIIESNIRIIKNKMDKILDEEEK